VTGTSRWLVLLLSTVSLGASCGETNIDAIARLRPRGSELRSRLVEVSLALPPPGAVGAARPPISAFVPPLVLDYEGGRSNADVLMESQLTRPERDISAELDLMLSVDLLSCLLWTGPKNPLDQSVWDDSTGLGADCERAFAVRWLVVIRPSVYDLPERVELQVFVVDMLRRQVVAEIPIALAGRYDKADLGRGRFAGEAERQLRSDAFVVARCAVSHRIDALPGAVVHARKSWLDGADACATVPTTFRELAPLRQAR